MAGKALIGVVAFVVGIALIQFLLVPTIEDTTTEAYAEPFLVTTNASETQTTQTLSYSHWYGDLTSLTATSNETGDTPVVMSYNPDTYATVVSGLAVSDTRLLTINYVKNAREVFTGMSTFTRLSPFLLIIGMIVAVIVGLYKWRHG